ncbi:L-xylulose reductase [Ascosphaera apis ARSEF 7405]|uniref:L-xylulose reductase n=1 Tax=Ascosphaera apis ARSEF 7405 TaxID=392613 RepID=A0A167Z8A3_9EURO|nr:L-xylulose reductase [Ascosphaera apis ARSEF 7405]
MDGVMTGKGTFNPDITQAPDFSKGILNLFSLKGKTAIITGAGAGIGWAVARAYAEAGANVAITYNTNHKAPERAAELEEKYGVKSKAYQLDVRTYDPVEKVIDQIVADFNGRLDVFVANAGIPWTQSAIVQGSIEHYQDVMKTNVDGVFYCARVAAKHWRRQKQEGTDLNGNKLENFTAGSFVATASMSGSIVNIPQLQAAYNASKASVIHMCHSLAVEWTGLARANTVSPGYTATEISGFVPEETKKVWRAKTPMGREGEPEEMCGAYLFLGSDASSFVTGADIIVDGGYCLP